MISDAQVLPEISLELAKLIARLGIMRDLNVERNSVYLHISPTSEENVVRIFTQLGKKTITYKLEVDRVHRISIPFEIIEKPEFVTLAHRISSLDVQSDTFYADWVQPLRAVIGDRDYYLTLFSMLTAFDRPSWSVAKYINNDPHIDNSGSALPIPFVEHAWAELESQLLWILQAVSVAASDGALALSIALLNYEHSDSKFVNLSANPRVANGALNLLYRNASYRIGLSSIVVE